MHFSQGCTKWARKHAPAGVQVATWLIIKHAQTRKKSSRLRAIIMKLRAHEERKIRCWMLCSAAPKTKSIVYRDTLRLKRQHMRV